MESISIQMNFDNFEIKLKDVLQIVIYAVLGALAFSAQSAKIDKQSDKLDLFIEAVKEIKADTKESKVEERVASQTLINQVNANTLQIKLLEQDVNALKSHKNK